MSPPAWGRGLKRYLITLKKPKKTSPPAWGRGLKQSETQYLLFKERSPPAWGRGLKLPLICLGVLSPPVAPRVGAWIETRFWCVYCKPQRSPPAWGRGLKHRQSENQETPKTSPPAWGRGLKLLLGFILISRYHVAPRVGAWIETSSFERLKLTFLVAPRVGAWIETYEQRPQN